MGGGSLLCPMLPQFQTMQDERWLWRGGAAHVIPYVKG